VIFAIVDFDDIPLIQCRKMIGLLAIADATSRIDLSGPWACVWPLHTKDIVHADSWWQWARRAGLPAQTKYWGLRMTRGIRDPAMDTGVVLLCYPYGVQSYCHFRRLGAWHLTTCGAEKPFDLPLILGVMGWGIIHGQLDHGTDATKFT